MRFEWDEAKNRANLKKHGIEFSAVRPLFAHPLTAYRIDEALLNERRMTAIGYCRVELLRVTYIESNESVRIISVRKCSRKERKEYEEGCL
ncbi:BrnT family toxin [Massilia sp. YIM B04103]|uniref:BrnT family toxin n=1 Tax=Massilia sp. YIM B04103 TaxID=2963106 RepID=UPI0035A57C29